MAREKGTLYPVLYRLERQGLIRSGWTVTANNRRASCNALTGADRRRFTDEFAQWQRRSRAVDLVLEVTATKS